MIHCIIPAAGESIRFPWNKILYTYENEPIILQTIRNVIESSSVDKIIVVAGHRHEEVFKIIKIVVFK